MAETASPADYAPQKAAAQPAADVVQDFSAQKKTTWSDVASQCWSGDLDKCSTAFADAFKQTFGFGSKDAERDLENRGLLPNTRINDGDFAVDWGTSGRARSREGGRPLVVQSGDRQTDGSSAGEKGARPRLELVKQPELPVPASGKMALEPVSDPSILNDVSKRPDGKPIEPTYIGVDNAASYKGADGRKHIKAGTPAWLDKPAAQAFVMMNEKLAALGKRVTLASEGDSTDGAINSAGRTGTQQAIATGIHAPPGRSEHEKGRGLDVRNFQDPDIKAALKEFGFVQGNLSNPGVAIRGDAWHFSFNPKAEADIARRFAERQAKLGSAPDTMQAPEIPSSRGQRRVELPDIGQLTPRAAERNRYGDRNSALPSETGGEAGKVYEFKLDHNTGRHKVDASVIVPRGYDPDKPTRLIIYNHGFRTDAHAALNYSELPEQMKAADAQTILVVPEWQANPGSQSSSRGRSDQPGFYKGMLNEIMQKTPELRGKTVDDIASLGIIAHSAGYNPAMAQLYNNGLGSKITSVTVLDSMYNPQAYDRWITDNLPDIAAGNKQFQLIYTGHLANQSRALESRVEQQLMRAGLGTQSLYKEHGRGGEIVSPETMAQYGFVFKRSEFTTRGDGAHGAMTHIYLRQLLNSERRRRG